MGIWPICLGAASIKLLGFSFTAARLPTFLTALVTVYLIQRTLVRFGISDAYAVLGTLTFALSPLFMPLAATLMTDIPGFFSVLACMYGCVRALQSESDRDAARWLCFAVGVNAICGTSRQIVWLGVLVMVPSTLWLMRSRRTVLIRGLIATALGYIFVFATLHWFNVQPYSIPEPFVLPPFHPLVIWKYIGRRHLLSLVEMALLLSPLTMPYIGAVRRFNARQFAALTWIIVLFLAFVYCLGRTDEMRALLHPYYGDWLEQYAIFDGTYLASKSPIILTPWINSLLAIVSIAGILSVTTIVLVLRPPVVQPSTAISLSWQQIAVILGPLTFCYFVLLTPRFWITADRYLLTPIFVALICLMLYSQQRFRGRWRTESAIALAAVAFYGIITTHNTFAFDRARVALAREVFAAGVPPSHFDLGWEANAWYELQLSTHVNDPRIVHPAGAYVEYPAAPRFGCHDVRYPFGFLTPHLAPRYGIAYEPNDCDGTAPFPPVTYSTWPLRRPTSVYVIKYPPPWQSAIESANRPTASPR
jgi:hypothetical protein